MLQPCPGAGGGRRGREAVPWLLWKEREANKAVQQRGQQGWSRSRVDAEMRMLQTRSGWGSPSKAEHPAGALLSFARWGHTVAVVAREPQEAGGAMA